jgi:hypothetical protein
MKNGWLLVPEGQVTSINATVAGECVIFKTLEEFAKSYPQRERRRRTKKSTTPKETSNASDKH